MENNNETDNGVNGTGGTVEGSAPGSWGMEGQAPPARHLTTRPNTYPRRPRGTRQENPNGRKKWSKLENKIAMECFFEADALGGRGIGDRVIEIWNERGMFPIAKDRLMCQIRVIKRITWFTLVELDEMKQGAKKRARRRQAKSDEDEESDLDVEYIDNLEADPLTEEQGNVEGDQYNSKPLIAPVVPDVGLQCPNRPS